MENTVKEQNVQLTDIREITIGNTTYIVKSNASRVPKESVKKAVERLIFNDLKHKI